VSGYLGNLGLNMANLNIIMEYEGPIVDIRSRYFSAHKSAVTAIGYQGPPQEEYWRLVRTASPDSMMARHAKPQKVTEYIRWRDEKINSTELMGLDEMQSGVQENLKLFKQWGSCHLVTLCSNRDGVNATLDRFDIWMHFDRKHALPADRDRRIEAIRQMTGENGSTLAIVGTVAVAYAANEAGCRCVGFNNGPAVPRLLRQVGVDLFYRSFDELTQAIIHHDPDLQRIGVVF